MQTQLLDYQQKAVDKLRKYRVGALYMEQGTGKTRTALELINLRLDAQKIDHVLWLCPCSVKKEIVAQLYEHIGERPDYFVIRGIESISQSDRLYLKLHAFVERTNCFIIIDESNLIKNFDALRTRRIIELGKKCRYRIILNGTPISRNEADLFAQWYFLDWRILGYKSYWSFTHNHIVYDDRYPGKQRIRQIKNVEYLVRRIEPYTYQIKKSECLSLPAKCYTSHYVSLTTAQEEHYSEVREGFLDYLDEQRPETIYRLFNALQSVVSGFRILSAPNRPIKKEPFFDALYDNPRLHGLMNIVKSNEHDKIIIFCHYQREIKEITDYLNEVYGIGAAVAFYGKTPLKARYAQIHKFKTTARFFVANKRCAGYGLNLQFCHHSIYYSNDWDLATRLQSEDRVHRIGQTQAVNITDLCAHETIDERIVECLWRKERLADAFKNEIAKQSMSAGRSKNQSLAAWLDGRRS